MLQELESWFEEGLRFVGNDILPAVSLALNFIPGVPAVVPAIFQKMPDLIATAEKVFPGDGKGGLKQDYFMKTAELVATDMGGQSIGGQAHTWSEIQPKIDPILSLVVAAINRFKPGAVDTTPSDGNRADSAGVPGAA